MSFLRSLGRGLGNVFIKPDATGDDRHRRLYVAGVIVIFTPVGFWAAGDDLQAGRLLEVAYIGLLVLPLLGSLVAIRFARDIRWGYRAVAAPVVLGTAMLLFAGAGEGYAFVFFFVPAGLCYTLGSKEGGVWFAGSLVMYAVVLGLDLGAGNPTP